MIEVGGEFDLLWRLTHLGELEETLLLHFIGIPLHLHLLLRSVVLFFLLSTCLSQVPRRAYPVIGGSTFRLRG